MATSSIGYITQEYAMAFVPMSNTTLVQEVIIDSNPIKRKLPSCDLAALDQSLEPIIKDVMQSLEKDFSLLKIVPHTLKRALTITLKCSCANLAETAGKIILLVGGSYFLRNIVWGIVGGEVLFYYFPLSQVLSSDPDIAVNAANFDTNAAANASFCFDAASFLYIMYKGVFSVAYKEVACTFIQNSYQKHIADLEGLSNAQRDRLYQLMHEQLKRYSSYFSAHDINNYIPVKLNEPKVQIISKKPPKRLHRVVKMSIVELDASLQKVFAQIKTELDENFSFRKMIPTVLKIVFKDAWNNKWLSAAKIAGLAGGCYLLKNIFIGICGGQVLFENTSFTDMLSSNSTTAINTAGLDTNAAASASFCFDGFAVLLFMYIVAVKNPHNKAAALIFKNAYEKHISNIKLSQAQRNRLYELLLEELKQKTSYFAPYDDSLLRLFSNS